MAVLGVTFKPNTDDMREAPSLSIIPALQAAGAKVRAHDPEGMAEAAKLLSDVEWCDGPYHAAERADALVIITEWDAYRALDLARLGRSMRGRVFIDLRNIYKADEAEAAGFAYHGIGLGTPAGGKQPRLAQVVAGPQQATSEVPVLRKGYGRKKQA